MIIINLNICGVNNDVSFKCVVTHTHITSYSQFITLTSYHTHILLHLLLIALVSHHTHILSHLHLIILTSYHTCILLHLYFIISASYHTYILSHLHYVTLTSYYTRLGKLYPSEMLFLEDLIKELIPFFSIYISCTKSKNGQCYLVC